jgi:hypothetical protein
MTKSQLFTLAHQITKTKNIAFFGSYQKAFAVILKRLYADKLGYGFQIIEPARVWA